jgi:proline racemase
MGTLASAAVVGITEVGGHKAILPEVTYQVFITGLHQYLIDENDPLKEGYQISS